MSDILISLVLLAAIALLTARLLRQPTPRRCAWCGQLSTHTIDWHGGAVCADCAERAVQPADHY